jgi:hypothetical protein
MACALRVLTTSVPCGAGRIAMRPYQRLTFKTPAVRGSA